MCHTCELGADGLAVPAQKHVLAQLVQDLESAELGGETREARLGKGAPLSGHSLLQGLFLSPSLAGTEMTITWDGGEHRHSLTRVFLDTGSLHNVGSLQVLSSSVAFSEYTDPRDSCTEGTIGEATEP